MPDVTTALGELGKLETALRRARDMYTASCRSVVKPLSVLAEHEDPDVAAAARALAKEFALDVTT